MTLRQLQRASLDNADRAVPNLRPHEGSWVCTSPCGRAVELFERSNAVAAAAAGWKVETVLQYLGRINAAVAEGGAL